MAFLSLIILRAETHVRIAFLILFAFLPALSAHATALPEINDRPWDRAMLDPILNSNLALNGSQAISFPEAFRKGPDQILPCWSEYFFPQNRIKLHSLDVSSNIYVRSVQYFFSGSEPAYRVMLKGRFATQAKLQLRALICTSACDMVDVPLQRTNATTFTGEMPPGEKLSYAGGFVIGVGAGVERLDGIRVANSSVLNDSQLMERDRRSIGMCYETKSPLVGSVAYTDFIPMLGIAALSLALIWILARRRETFPLILSLGFFATNVVGLFLLYFGLSDIRLEQAVADRSLIVSLAWYQCLVITMASACYLGMKRLLPKVVHLPDLSVSYHLPSTLVVYGILFVLSIWFGFRDVIDYYVTLMSDHIPGAATRASVIRNNISSNALGIKSHWYKLIFTDIPTFLNLLLIVYSTYTRRFWLASALFVAQSFLLVLSGEKAPIVWHLGAVVFILITLYRTPPKTVLLSFVSITALGCLLVIWGPKSVLLWADRALLGSLTVAYTALKIFPAEHTFLGGASLRIFDFGITAEQFDLDLFMWRQIFHSSYFSHLSGTATGPFWLQGYANFGAFGAALFAATFGLILAAVEFLASKIRHSFVRTGLLAWLVGHYASFGESNLTRFILDFYLFGLIAFIALYGVLSVAARKVSARLETKGVAK
ncbi:hypothetical protein [Hydrogenophaga aquatica]